MQNMVSSHLLVVIIPSTPMSLKWAHRAGWCS